MNSNEAQGIVESVISSTFNSLGWVQEFDDIYRDNVAGLRVHFECTHSTSVDSYEPEHIRVNIHIYSIEDTSMNNHKIDVVNVYSTRIENINEFLNDVQRLKNAVMKMSYSCLRTLYGVNTNKQ